MRGKLKLRNGLVLFLLISILIVGASITIAKLYFADHNRYDNQIRIDLSESLENIRKGSYEKAAYPYIVIDLSGVVLYSDYSDYKAGQTVYLNEQISYDESFHATHDEYKEVIALEDKGQTDRFAVFFVPEEKRNNHDPVMGDLLPFLLSIVADFMIAAAYCFYMNRNVFRPINEISESANAIIKGNYDVEVVRIYGTKVRDGEVGELIYSFELMRDELKEKQLREEQLKLNEKELISCISHDLRTPLSTIKAYAEGIRDGIARTKEDRETYLHVILDKTNLLVGMIHDLLEYSNASVNQLKIERKECYLQEFLVPIVKELGPFIRKHDIAFETDITSQDVILRIDTKRITEVIYNLVENSIKYRDKVHAVISFGVSIEKDSVLFQIKDNGMGISADDILYVFDKFYRTEKSRCSKVPGSGLGLSICQYIIKEHNGEIYCKSRQGIDCEIGFTIPFI